MSRSVFDKGNFSQQDRLEKRKSRSNEASQDYNAGFSAGYDAARQRYMPVGK